MSKHTGLTKAQQAHADWYWTEGHRGLLQAIKDNAESYNAMSYAEGTAWVRQWVAQAWEAHRTAA
jgi:hypothetical protein